jgi:putative membrane protein
MNLSFRAFVRSCLIAAAIMSGIVLAQPNTAGVDKAFLDKIAQDNLYQLEAGKLAEQMADGEDIKDLAWKEVRDHELINRELATLASANNISLPSKLTPELQQRLDRMNSASGRDFDNAYLAAMVTVHKADEQLLTHEASGSGSSEYKSFVARTEAIFKRHLATLQSSDAKD